MEMLESQIVDMFNAADEEGKGYLSRAQATTVVTNLAAQLSFNSSQVQYIMTEADENNDGMIDFNEFLPLMMELIQLLIAKGDVEAKLAQNEAEVEDKLLHGMDRATLNNLLLSIFQSADADGSGALDRREFQNALKSADLGLTRKEINGLLHAVDENEDGEISYEEFAPVAFDLCVQIYARQVAHEALPTGEKEICDYFQQLFASADTDSTGRLSHRQLAELLRTSDLGMSRVQMHAVLGEAVKDEDGTVNYTDFATTAATMVGSMLNFEDQAERLAYRNENEGKVDGMDEIAFKNAMVGALQAVAGDNATLPLDSIQDAVFTVLPQCTGNEMNGLLSMLYEQDENGNWSYDDLIEYGFLVLLEVREAMAMRG
jgi:Ca2+-binding EF-hand superfamily protein